jgi:hypothetical protein
LSSDVRGGTLLALGTFASFAFTELQAAEIWKCSPVENRYFVDGREINHFQNEGYLIQIEKAEVFLVPISGDIIEFHSVAKDSKTQLFSQSVGRDSPATFTLALDKRAGVMTYTARRPSGEVYRLHTGRCGKQQG